MVGAGRNCAPGSTSSWGKAEALLIGNVLYWMMPRTAGRFHRSWRVQEALSR